MLQELSARLLLGYASNISLHYGLLALCVGCPECLFLGERLVHDFDGLTKPFFRLVREPTFVLRTVVSGGELVGAQRPCLPQRSCLPDLRV